MLPIFLAQNVPEHWTRMVVMEPFERVNEIWSEGTRLGLKNEQFKEVYEEDLEAELEDQNQVI